MVEFLLFLKTIPALEKLISRILDSIDDSKKRDQSKAIDDAVEKAKTTNSTKDLQNELGKLID